jgi:predicted nucleic acid-binding protein
VAQGLALVADSNAWISFYRNDDSTTKRLLAESLRNHTLLLPDLVIVEVLRGMDAEPDTKAIALEFENFQTVDIAGRRAAVKAAENYRSLRAKGITIRRTVDLLIATWCIENDIPLLHADGDFSGFELHLGLKRWSSDIEERS